MQSRMTRGDFCPLSRLQASTLSFVKERNSSSNRVLGIFHTNENQNFVILMKKTNVSLFEIHRNCDLLLPKVIRKYVSFSVDTRKNIRFALEQFAVMMYNISRMQDKV